MATKILIEPGRNWSSTTKSKIGNVHERELYTDIVYKVMKYAKNHPNEVLIINPSWANKHKTAKDRIEYINTTEYDILISLRYSDEMSRKIIVSETDAHSRSIASSFTSAVGNPPIELTIKNLPNIVKLSQKPAFVFECLSVHDDELLSQSYRNNIAEKIWSGICNIINIGVTTTGGSKLTAISKPEIKWIAKGITLIDNIPVRGVPLDTGYKLIDLPKDYPVIICDTVKDEWYKIYYGENCGYIDASLVKVIKTSYHSKLNPYQRQYVTNVNTEMYGEVSKFITLVYEETSDKIIGALTRNCAVRIVGSNTKSYIVVFGTKFARIPKQNIKLLNVCENCIDVAEDNSAITMSELNRRGYTHVIY